MKIRKLANFEESRKHFEHVMAQQSSCPYIYAELQEKRNEMRKQNTTFEFQAK